MQGNQEWSLTVCPGTGAPGDERQWGLGHVSVRSQAKDPAISLVRDHSPPSLGFRPKQGDGTRS